MIPVCIPYVQSKWGKELKYALRSWDCYFNEDFTVYVIGGIRPEWLDKKHFIRVPDNPGKHKESNQGKKLRYCSGIFKNFIWSDDDIFLLRDTCLSFIKRPLYHQTDVNLLKKTPKQRKMAERLLSAYKKFRTTGEIEKIGNSSNPLWQILLAGTANHLGGLRYTAYNGETHTPYHYESEKLIRLSKAFDIFDPGFHLTRTAYINVFNRFRSDLSMMNGEKAGFYGQKIKDGEDPFERLRNSVFLNFNDSGLSSTLKRWIQYEFKSPSRFEK